MTSPMYIAEISPARIRGRMVSVNQFAIVSGMLVVYFVNYFITRHGQAVDSAAGLPRRATLERAARLALDVRFRSPAGAGAAGAAVLRAGKPALADAKQGYVDKARDDPRARRRRGARRARNAARSRPPWPRSRHRSRSCFRPGMRIVLVIGVVLAVLQQVTGINVFLYYAPEIFKTVAGSDVGRGTAADGRRRRGEPGLHGAGDLDRRQGRPQAADDRRRDGHGHLAGGDRLGRLR